MRNKSNSSKCYLYKTCFFFVELILVFHQISEYSEWFEKFLKGQYWLRSRNIMISLDSEMLSYTFEKYLTTGILNIQFPKFLKLIVLK